MTRKNEKITAQGIKGATERTFKNQQALGKERGEKKRLK